MQTNPINTQRIMITGGSSGLGWAIAQRCVAQQAVVHVLDVQLPPSTDVSYSALDVTDAEAWRELADAHRTAPPDTIFLNAGVMSAAHGSDPELYRFAASDPTTYARIRGANIDDVVLGLQAMLPILKPGGCVIVTSSLAGLHDYPFDPLYAMTKHAVVGLVTSLREEFCARDLRIHAFCPNRIVTPLRPAATARDTDLHPAEAASAAVGLIAEPRCGYAWALDDAASDLRRVPAPPEPLWRKVIRRLQR